MLAVMGLLVVATLGAGLYAWVVAAGKLARGEPLVDWNPRQPVPWAIIDLFVVIVAALFVGLAIDALHWLPAGRDWKEFTLAEQRRFVGGNILIPLLTVALGLPLIYLRSGAKLPDFGWSHGHFRGDVRLGLIAFAMLSPPVYALQAMLVTYWQPSVHPLVEGFRQTRDIPLFILAALAAVIVAPLVEELLFRVLLQGFLEKAFSGRCSAVELVLGSAPPLGNEPLPCTEYSVPSASPESPVTSFGSAIEGQANQKQPLPGPAAWLSVAISSLVFALLHWQHGPDWIPLILLAAGLGYLYQRTHRLLPSLTVHAALNAASMWGLWVQVNEGLSS